MGWRGVAGLGVALVSLAGAAGARAAELSVPKNVKEPSTRQSAALSTQAAIADMKGNPTQARELANQAIRADPRDPWPYYNKGMALAQLGETDGALAALFAAEQHFSPADRWGRSVAIYGRAHTLAKAGRCSEAREAYEAYASFVEKDDALGAEMARRYAGHCRPAMPAAASSAAAPEQQAPAAPGQQAPKR